MQGEVSAIHHLINSVISSSYFISTFTFKWQAMRDKLEKLNCDLKSAAALSADSSQVSLLRKLLNDVSMTATDIQLLADHCSDGSYNGGKLLMKSEVDKASARLDILINRVAEFYSLGILMHSDSIVVAKPASGADGDDMSFYIRDLSLRLRIGDSKMKASALAAIIEVLRVDEKYLKILVVDIDDGIALLVNLLELSDVGIQEEALEVILIIAGFDSFRGALVNAGIVGRLVRILEAGSKLGKVRAGCVLNNLTENSDNVWSLAANGGITALLKLIEDTENSVELIFPCCDVLQNLSSVTEIKKFMVEKGVVSAFLPLLESKEERARIRAIEFLTDIALEDDDIKAEIVRGGGTHKLLKLLNPNTSHSATEREVALRAMGQSCFSASNSINPLFGSEFFSWILFFLKKGVISTQEVALQAMLRLCEASNEAKKEMGDSGFIPVVVKLLEAKSSTTCEMAAELLVKLVSVQKNRKRFIDEEQNVNLVLELLNPVEDVKESKRFLLPLLTSLTNSNSGRRKIAASGYVQNLERLAETDVIDAKKIIKKISRSRFRNLLNGIWSF